MRNFSRLFCIGTVKLPSPRGNYEVNAKVFVEVFYKDGKLSMTGVEGPLRNGDAIGSCGQIDGHLKLEDLTLMDGWTIEDVRRLFEIWHEWHLNDMQPGCEHQRANWNTTEEIEVVEYGLTTDAYQEIKQAKEDAIKRLIDTGRVEASDDLRALLALPWTRKEAPDADSVASGRYEVKKREKKMVGWVRPDEHPKGILAKPCEVCGYKYGSQWKKKEVPEDVLEWLASMSDTEEQYPWPRRH